MLGFQHIKWKVTASTKKGKNSLFKCRVGAIPYALQSRPLPPLLLSPVKLSSFHHGFPLKKGDVLVTYPSAVPNSSTNVLFYEYALAFWNCNSDHKEKKNHILYSYYLKLINVCTISFFVSESGGTWSEHTRTTFCSRVTCLQNEGSF